MAMDEHRTTTDGTRSVRSLAAIVFTDAVGYSERASRDEKGALNLLAADFEMMQKACGAHDGRVVKSTGDGLLMVFSSAVQAVSCSLEILQKLQTRTSIDGFEHRIGVHLGDVVFQSDDVMGDGVNIAARLQQIALPQSISITESLFEIVRNKIPFDAVYTGKQSLKNIAEPLGVYRLTPGDGSKSVLAPSANPRQRKALWLGGIIGASLVVILGVLFAFTFQKDGKQVGQAMKKSGVVGAQVGSEMAASMASLTAEQSQITQLKSSYKFDEILDVVTSSKAILPEEKASLYYVYSSLLDLKSSVVMGLETTSEQEPLKVSGYWEDRQRNIECFWKGNLLQIREDGETESMRLESVPPWMFRSIALQLMEDARSEDVGRSFEQIVYFSEAYALPLPEQLVAMNPPSAG
jgi:class 3 adenylate cyclase